jgi:hypothetical protein
LLAAAGALAAMTGVTTGMAPAGATTMAAGVVASGVTVPDGVAGAAPEAGAGPEGSRFIGFGLIRAIIGLP